MGQLFAAFGVSVSLILAQAVNFGILLIALWYFLYKPIMKVLAERQAKVAQGVIDADRATEKLASADTEAATVVKSAEVEADGIVKSARDTGKQERERIVKEADARAAAIAADADARAKETAAKSVRESEKEIARIAILAAEKVLHQKAAA
jgi:F-type H+-transporting ATPase subunit b